MCVHNVSLLYVWMECGFMYHSDVSLVHYEEQKDEHNTSLWYVTPLHKKTYI